MTHSSPFAIPSNLSLLASVCFPDFRMISFPYSRTVTLFCCLIVLAGPKLWPPLAEPELKEATMKELRSTSCLYEGLSENLNHPRYLGSQRQMIVTGDCCSPCRWRSPPPAVPSCRPAVPRSQRAPSAAAGPAGSPAAAGGGARQGARLGGAARTGSAASPPR